MGGVYGIYNNDELLYVGSSVNLISRWREHDRCFRIKSSGTNEMYGLPDIDPNKLVYKMILSGLDIAKTCNLKNQSTWLMEFAEWVCIINLRPKWNKAGTSTDFKFHQCVKMSLEVKNLLENDRFNKKQEIVELDDTIVSTALPQTLEQITPSIPEPLTHHQHPQEFPSNFLSQDNEILLSLPTITLPQQTFPNNGFTSTSRKAIVYNQGKSNFLITENTPPETLVNIIDPTILYQPIDSPYHLSDWAFAYWQNYCERSATRNNPTLKVLDSQSKQELIEKGYLIPSPDKPSTYQLLCTYIKQQLPLKEATNV